MSRAGCGVVAYLGVSDVLVGGDESDRSRWRRRRRCRVCRRRSWRPRGREVITAWLPGWPSRTPMATTAREYGDGASRDQSERPGGPRDRARGVLDRPAVINVAPSAPGPDGSSGDCRSVGFATDGAAAPERGPSPDPDPERSAASHPCRRTRDRRERGVPDRCWRRVPSRRADSMSQSRRVRLEARRRDLAVGCGDHRDDGGDALVGIRGGSDEPQPHRHGRGGAATVWFADRSGAVVLRVDVGGDRRRCLLVGEG